MFLGMEVGEVISRFLSQIVLALAFATLTSFFRKFFRQPLEKPSPHGMDVAEPWARLAVTTPHGEKERCTIEKIQGASKSEHNCLWP